MKRNVVIAIAVLIIGIAVVIIGRSFGNTRTATGPITAVPVASSANNSLLRFRIVPEESKAQFKLSEILRGNPTEVVGVSNQVAGEIVIDPKNLGASQLGVIQINARTLATDSNQRNGAIRRFILNTDTYEFITFKPTAISGLSGDGALNKPFTFKIQGDLTIRDVTKPVVFDATVQAPSAERLTGSASTTINRADFNLKIPDVPFVANVSEQVALGIDFVATPVKP